MSDLLDIDCLVLGEFMTNCFVVRPAGEKDCWVFDPGLRASELLQWLEGRALTVGRIVITHGHADHIAGVSDVLARFPSATLTAPARDAVMLTDPVENLSAAFGFTPCAEAGELLRPDDTLTQSGLERRVLDTSGHSPGGVSYHCSQAQVVIAGDALFAGSIGRCDFPGSDANQLVGNIHKHLLSLPDDTRVLCGHGPETTIGAERQHNPYLGGR